VLYDFDGTLVDTVPMILECFQKAFLEVTGHTENEAFLLSTIGLPLSQAFLNYDPHIQVLLQDAYQKVNAILLPTAVGIFDGIIEGLTAMRTLGVRQGVVTSKKRETTLYSMRQFKMDTFFEILITREDTVIHKPNPEPIYLALQQMNISDKSRILYVGDSVHDLRCAANAGVDSAAVNWTYMPRNDLAAEKPKYWLDRLTDLSCILLDAEL
jgi:pyrophosphatase PpaX